MELSTISAGSRGDVQPYVALGVGLREAGHRVRFLAPSDYEALAVEHGLAFVDLGGTMRSVAQGLEGQLVQGNMLKIMLTMWKAAAQLVGEATERSVRASEGSHAVLAGLGALSIAVTTSETLHIPYIPAFLYPFTPTSEFASVLSPVHILGSVPHAWLFPRMAAVVHHGGVGTTAAGLGAGVPSILTPFFGDPPCWGRRVFEQGVGPWPIPRRQLEVDSLARAISVAVSSKEMREKAVALGSSIRREDGVSEAVRVLERTVPSA